MQRVVLDCHLWPVKFSYILPHYVINGPIFRTKLLNIKCVFWFFLQLLSETVVILRRTEGDMIINYIGLHVKYTFIHSVFCLTTGPKPPLKRFLHIVRSRASSFKREYLLLSLRSSSSFLRLPPHLLVTSISPFIFPSITCFRRQFLRKMWPIQLAFRFLISCRTFLCSLTLSNTSLFLTWSVQLTISNNNKILTAHVHVFQNTHYDISQSVRYILKER